MDRNANDRNDRSNGRTADDWIVRDDLGPAMPVSDEELAVVEAYLGALITEIMQADEAVETARTQRPDPQRSLYVRRQNG